MHIYLYAFPREATKQEYETQTKTLMEVHTPTNTKPGKESTDAERHSETKALRYCDRDKEKAERRQDY